MLVAALLALVTFALGPSGRAGIEAVSLLIDVWSVAREGGAADPPLTTITYTGPAGALRRADLYCDPSSPPGARLLLAHGLVEAGKDDSRLRALGHAFARHRVLVVVPDFPGMRSLMVGRADIDEVAAAIEATRRISACPPAGAPTGVPDGTAPRTGGTERPGLPTGVVGFSYSAGPLLLALDREETARSGDFAVLFGGYDDLVEVARFLTTGRSRDLGTENGGEALPEGRWILLQANADVLASPSDRTILKEIARLKRRAVDADTDALAAPLGPSGRAVLDLITNTDPGRFDALFRKVDPALRDTLEALSPARSLRRPLDVDLFLLHGRSDAIVPFTESVKLSRSVRTRGAVHLALLGGFGHARPRPGGSAPVWESLARYPADSARLLAILEDILARRRESP